MSPSLPYKTLDEVKAEIDKWHEDHPWISHWYGVRRRLKDLWDLRLIPLRKWERASKGYSYADWWSFDTYISGVIGRACEDFREKGHGYPGDMTEDEWNDILDRISGPLLTYASDKFEVEPWEVQEQKYKDACEAMKLFGDNLGGMWD